MSKKIIIEVILEDMEIWPSDEEIEAAAMQAWTGLPILDENDPLIALDTSFQVVDVNLVKN